MSERSSRQILQEAGYQVLGVPKWTIWTPRRVLILPGRSKMLRLNFSHRAQSFGGLSIVAFDKPAPRAIPRFLKASRDIFAVQKVFSSFVFAEDRNRWLHRSESGSKK